MKVIWGRGRRRGGRGRGLQLRTQQSVQLGNPLLNLVTLTAAAAGLEVSAVWGEGVMMIALWGRGVVLAASGA